MADDTCHKIFPWELKDILQPTGEYSPPRSLDPPNPGSDIFLLTPSGKTICYFAHRVYINLGGFLLPRIPYKIYRLTDVS